METVESRGGKDFVALLSIRRQQLIVTFCIGFSQKTIHVVWGIPLNLSSPANLVTAYRLSMEQ
jgi:hypothetical protein